MNIITMLLLSITVAIDAFTVSISSATSLNSRRPWGYALLAAIFFGLFQLFMPLIGGLVGEALNTIINSIGQLLAVIMLLFFGGKMIFEGLNSSCEAQNSTIFTISTLFLVAFATSIDAFAIGTSIILSGYGFLQTLLPTAILMGLVTALMSFCGVFIGQFLVKFWGKRLEIFGGVVLILLAIKILIEHIH